MKLIPKAFAKWMQHPQCFPNSAKKHISYIKLQSLPALLVVINSIRWFNSIANFSCQQADIKLRSARFTYSINCLTSHVFLFVVKLRIFADKCNNYPLRFIAYKKSGGVTLPLSFTQIIFIQRRLQFTSHMSVSANVSAT